MLHAHTLVEEECALTPVNRNRLVLSVLWVVLYSSFALVTPPLLDDADSVHAEVAREMVLRHDWITLYANGIRYLEKAPLLYWSMAACFKFFGPHTAVARLPLAATVLLLAFVVEMFARRAFQSVRAGLYAGLILLSSFGIFIFTRITIPDAMVCLWLALALLCYWITEQQERPSMFLCWGFAAACALNVLTKGLIGLVFPVAIVMLHLLAMRRFHAAFVRVRQFHLVTSFMIFLAIAAPWHILAGLANPTQGQPGNLTFSQGHWIIPQPTQGNVHGWFWFYFVNEHLLRYLNLRVPRDYDTVPLGIFWGLILVWLMPWSAFLIHAVAQVPWKKMGKRDRTDRTESTMVLLGIWAALPLIFFSFSTRQEYYVLPSLPALGLLIAHWLAREADEAESFAVPGRMTASGQRIAVGLLMVGSIGALAAGYFLLHSQPADPNTDLASLLRQNPGDYALSFGHFLDLNARAMGSFRRPLAVAAVALFGGTLVAWLLRRQYRPHLANLALASGAILFLLAAHMGLQIFSPVLTSKPLADAIARTYQPGDIVIIDGEYEAASTLGFYLRKSDIHIYEGRSSNLWYGSFFKDSPPIFEDKISLSLKWSDNTRRIFLWHDLNDPRPSLPGKSFFVAQSGGKEIISNAPNPY